MTVVSPMLREALRLAELGYRVFPCWPGSKNPMTSHGFKDATTNPAVIEEWWGRTPDANIAIATAGLVVLDIDGADNRWFTGHPELQLDLVGAPTATTPRGGSHFYFREREGEEVRVSAGKIGDHVDIRARGGYVLVAPSVVNGSAYRWCEECSLECPASGLAPAPGWLLDMIAQSSVKRSTGLDVPASSPTGNTVSATVPEGKRHITMVSLAGTMRRRGLTASEIRACLATINTSRCAPPLPDDEIARIAESVGNYLPDERAAAEMAGADPKALTDLGNAERLEQRWAGRLLYCHAVGKWFVWDGRRWKPDDDGTPTRLAGISARELLASSAGEASGEGNARLKFALRSESRSHLDATLALGQSRPRLVVQVDALDADPMLFNTLGGTIDLRDGTIRAHDPADRITRLAPVEYSPVALCPRFDAFLEETFGGDVELTGFVQRFFGMCLTADIREQYLPIFFGSGANGKSVLIDTILHVMGDYADVAPPSLLEDRGTDEHPTEIADLKGKRLVVSSETEEGTRLKLQLIKRLTGDRTLKGRFMRQDYFSFDRTHKTILVTNNLPRISENSEAVWRRILLVPFRFTVPAERRDAKLGEALRAEAAGILAWMVRGCRLWQDLGLGSPPSVLGATNTYRSGEDEVGRFLEERCVREDIAMGAEFSTFTPWKDLYGEYVKWAEDAGVKAIDGTRFGNALDRRGLTTATQRVNGRVSKGRPGIELLSVRAERLPRGDKPDGDLAI